MLEFRGKITDPEPKFDNSFASETDPSPKGSIDFTSPDQARMQQWCTDPDPHTPNFL